MSATTGFPITVPQAIPPTTVSWQSVFWGLTPFVLSSMGQPAGMVCTVGSDVGYLLRSSPIMCILDALLVLYDLLSIYRTRRSYQDAKDEMIQRRFQSDAWKEFKRKKSDNPHLLRNDVQLLRLVGFLASLSQFVKIFAFGGLVWSKVIAALYLTSFLVIEALVVWPVSRKTEIKDVVMNSDAATAYICIALSMSFLLWFTSAAFRDISGQPPHTLAQWAGITSESLGVILAVPPMVYLYRHRRPGTRRGFKSLGVLLVVVLGTPVGFYLVGRSIPESVPIVWVGVVGAVLSVTWCGIGVLYVDQVITSFTQRLKDAQWKKVHFVTAWCFFILHLVTGLLYYRFSYDPTGTIKPAWTEQLG